MITSKFLSIHTDINSGVNLPSWLKPNHPNWIGAWWLPFLTFGFTSLIMALVIFFFPRKIKHRPVQNGNNNHSEGQQAAKEVEMASLMNGKSTVAAAGDNTVGGENGNVEHAANKEYLGENALVEAGRNFGSALSLNQLGTHSKNYKPPANGNSNFNFLNLFFLFLHFLTMCLF